MTTPNAVSAPRDLQPGQLLGAYRLVGRAGRGGMAEVWQAWQVDLNRAVAIKVLPRRLALQPGYLERFRREAQAISRLDHPNILTVHDFGEQDGLTYMVNPFIDGGTLEQRLTRPWSVLDALRLLAPLASALDYAHARGVIHRDVKPANVLMTAEGRPVLGDFGVAHVLEGAGDLTEAGTVIGTPHYMAPEQAAGETPGPACDLYALGVMLFQMLTGRLPFQGTTPVAVALAHLREAPPAARSLNPELSEAIEAILGRALAKRPAERYPSGAALIEALSTTAWETVPIQAPRPAPTERPTRSRWSLALGTLLLAASAGTAAWHLPLPAALPGLLTAAGQPQVATVDRGQGSTPAPPIAPRVGVLLRADDFSNPAQGLFRDAQTGTGQVRLANGRGADYRWRYGYQDRSLALKLLGPYPDPANQAILGVGAVAADRINTDFAAEVVANVTKSPGEALYGLRYSLAPGDSYFFRIGRDNASFELWSEQGPTSLDGGRTTSLQRGQPNTLRLEISGDTLRAFANGQLLASAQQPGLARRGGQLALLTEMAGPPADGEVEVRFSDLKLYTLAP